VEIKCQLDATDEFLLQILLLAQHVSGHHYAYHQELKKAIRYAIKTHLLHLVGILFTHIIDDARSKPHQNINRYWEQSVDYLWLEY
jgi:hypothetical protein